MKICPKCGKNYNEGSFCSSCGVSLQDITLYDAFGEEITNKKPAFSNTQVKSNFNIKSIDFKELLFILSFPAIFIPVYGLGICMGSAIINGLFSRFSKKNKIYMIISIVCAILSIFWMFLLLKSGVYDQTI